MSQDPALLTACELRDRYREKALSPVEVTEAALARIERLDPQLNAYLLVDAEGALAAARESERRWHKGEPRGLLDGVPTSVKDILLTEGWPTLRGSRTVDPDQDWTEDAPGVARVREHGAVLLGKTTTPEFGWKGVTDSPLTGITRNPWNLGKTPGGSSGGAAAAVATGMGALAFGTDGGGSIRIPAGFTGIFGIKPSFGRVPAYPLSPFGTVAHVGPMTRSVADAALMLSVISLPDPRDPYALPPEGRNYLKGLERGLEDQPDLRIAFSPTLGGKPVDPEVAALVERAAQRFVELGATVELAEPEMPDCGEIFRTLWFAGAGYILSSMTEAQREVLDPGFLEIARAGAEITLHQYIGAARAREDFSRTMKSFHGLGFHWQGWDLLLTPSLPIPAFDVGLEMPPDQGERRWVDWTPFTYPFNLTGQPAASIPCGLTEAGLPVGLQIVGPPFADALVLQAAAAFEAATPFPLPEL